MRGKSCLSEMEDSMEAAEYLKRPYGRLFVQTQTRDTLRKLLSFRDVLLLAKLRRKRSPI